MAYAEAKVKFGCRPVTEDSEGQYFVTYNGTDIQVPDFKTAWAIIDEFRRAYDDGYKAATADLREDLQRFSERFGR
jgi:hypothetical protein